MTTDNKTQRVTLELFDYDGAAEYLNCNRSLVESLKLQGLLPFVRVGGRFIRFRREDLDAFIDRSVVTANGVAK